MKTYLDCIPCFMRQTLDAVRRVTDDEAIHVALTKEILHAAATMDLRQSPPAMGQRIHRRIRELTGRADPYADAKAHFNRMALERLPQLRARVAQSPAPFETALRLSIAGNIIDMGVHSALTDARITEAIDRALCAPLCGDANSVQSVMQQANDILFLADNAGEIVFDRLLLEQLPLDRVTVAVRGAPVINDATRVDARVAGLTELVEVMDNGSDAPGTILEDCSVAFCQRFDRADLVIAKGQGNFETLSHVDKPIIFALMAKCPVIARELHCPVGSLVVRQSPNASPVPSSAPAVLESCPGPQPASPEAEATTQPPPATVRAGANTRILL